MDYLGQDLFVEEELSKIKELKRRGLISELHQRQINLLENFYLKKNWRLLEEHATNFENEYQNYFSYTVFKLHAYIKFERFKKLYENLLAVSDKIFLTKISYEDIDDSEAEILSILSELKIKQSEELHSYKCFVLIELFRSYQNQDYTPEDKKYLQNLFLIEESASLLIFSIFILGRKNKEITTLYYYGLAKQYYSFVSLTKYQSWLKKKLHLPSRPTIEINQMSDDHNPTHFVVSSKSKSMTVASGTLLSDVDERSLIAGIKVNPPNSKDLEEVIVAYQMMGLSKAAELLVDFENKNDFKKVRSKKICYLLLTSFLSQKKYYNALEIVQELRSFENSTEEIIELDYTEGSIYLFLNNKVLAKDFLLNVLRQNQNYRMIQERMKQIEKD